VVTITVGYLGNKGNKVSSYVACHLYFLVACRLEVHCPLVFNHHKHWAVAQTCCKAKALSIGKVEIRLPLGLSKTPEGIAKKLGVSNYVRDPMGEISLFVTFLFPSFFVSSPRLQHATVDRFSRSIYLRQTTRFRANAFWGLDYEFSHLPLFLPPPKKLKVCIMAVLWRLQGIHGLQYIIGRQDTQSLVGFSVIAK